MSLDKSSHASCKTQKFADMLEKGADSSELLKSQGTSLKTNDSLDTCTRMALISGFLSPLPPQMAEKKEKKEKERRKISRIALATEQIFRNGTERRNQAQTLASY